MFNGPDYIPELDKVRLTGQIQRIYDLMIDGTWRTLTEISQLARASESSASAQLRHLRKPRFGSYIVDKKRRGDRTAGLFEYKLIDPKTPLQLELF